MLKKGLVEVYTGNGKGKTTAAIGLAIRAAGRGLKVYIIHFMKSSGYGESNILKNIENIREVYMGKPYFITKDPKIKEIMKDVVVFEPGNPPKEYMEIIKKAMEESERIIFSGEWDVVILDEIITALYFDLIDVKEVLKMIQKKPDHVELILTGRYAPDEIIKVADLVTEMKEIKHPYQKGIEAREGIEY